MYGINFDNNATHYIVWLISELQNQYNWSIGEGDEGFELDINLSLEIIKNTVFETLDRYISRYSEMRNNPNLKLPEEYILDFRYKYKGKLAIEYLDKFINNIDTNLDIHGNPDDGKPFQGKMSDILEPIYNNLKEITELLLNDNSLII